MQPPMSQRLSPLRPLVALTAAYVGADARLRRSVAVAQPGASNYGPRNTHGHHQQDPGKHPEGHTLAELGTPGRGGLVDGQIKDTARQQQVAQVNVAKTQDAKEGRTGSPPPLAQSHAQVEGAQGAASELSGGAENEADDEEETCGWCIYMKGGPCKAQFVEWQSCIKRCREEDKSAEVASICKEWSQPLFSCMAQHDYYEDMVAASDDRSEADSGLEEQE